MASNNYDDKNIQELLAVLRIQNPTQYFTLIKMHLSFATDLSTDQCDGSFDAVGLSNHSKWNLSPLMRKFTRSNNLSRQSGDKSSLTLAVINQLLKLINFLKGGENIKQEGLFRKTGSVTRQAELKASLQAGEPLNLNSGIYSAHDCASVLKSFLADLPEPLLQEGQYHVHCRIAEMCRRNLSTKQQSMVHSRQVKALRLVFLLLPSMNYEVLKELLLLLNRVTLFQQVNKMSSLNLGTMFAPHILCPRKMSPNELQFQSGPLSSAIAFIIENAPQLFEVPSELEIDVREYFRTDNINRQLSKKSLEEAATKTSFTFVDRELTAKASDKDFTEMALAELYAFVQTLPDSGKKKKLVTQFNEVNGQGTPKYNQSTQKKTEFRVKALGDSIKKHLFNRSVKKSKTKKQAKDMSFKRSNSEDFLSKVMMTPRSRCPIIINSSSSLSSVVAIQEETLNMEARRGLPFPNLMEDSAVCGSPGQKMVGASEELSVSRLEFDESECERSAVQSKEACVSKNSSMMRSPVRRSASLLGGFFQHLSTTSLLKLASRLASTSSLAPEDEDSSHLIKGEHASHDDSLSTVFKEYLFNRSILTDSPIDLSTDSLIGDEESFNQLENTDHDRFKPKPNSQIEDTVNVSSSKLSKSLLYCLDGNNPQNYKRNPKRPSLRSEDSDYSSAPKRTKSMRERDAKNRLPLVEMGSPNSLTEKDETDSNDAKFGAGNSQSNLHSCSPNGRSSSLLKNRNGTPLIPHRENGDTSDHNVTDGSKSVLFETDL